MPPRKARLSPSERNARLSQRMSFGTLVGRAESASPARRISDPRVSQLTPKPAGGGPWAATLIVASSTSLHKESADFVCDGTDDQVEINDAIALLPNRGGRVLLLEGDYNISASVLISHWGVTLQGQGGLPETYYWEGGGTRLIIPPGAAPASFPIIWNGAYIPQPPPHAEQGWTASAGPRGNNSHGDTGWASKGTIIRDLCVDGNVYNLTGVDATHYNHGIYLDDETGAKILNVVVLSCSGTGIVAYSDNFEIAQCTIIGCYVHGIVAGQFSGYIHDNVVDECGQDYWYDRVFGEPWGAGICISFFNVNVVNNYVNDNVGDGIRVVYRAYDWLICNNHIDNGGEGAGGDANLDKYASIAIRGGPPDWTGTGDTGLRPGSIGEGTITGNVVWNGLATGILLSRCNGVAVIGNFIGATAGSGIRLFRCYDSHVADNVIAEAAYTVVAGTRTYDGIVLDGEVNRETQLCQVMGNLVRSYTDREPATAAAYMRYGIRLELYTKNNWCVLNDLRYSGATGSYSDVGTGNDNTTTGNLT